MSTLKITYTNFSSVEWTRWDWTTSGVDWDVTVNETPSKTLEAYSGQTSAELTVDSPEFFALGDLSAQVGFSYSGYYVGVYCQTHIQVFGIGKGCTWQALEGTKWHGLGENSTPITWNFPGFVITATPSLEHEHASISVIIKDKK